MAVREDGILFMPFKNKRDCVYGRARKVREEGRDVSREGIS